MKGNAAIVTHQLRLLLLFEAKQRCELCNKPLKKRFELHHRDGCGLNWHRDNLVILCVNCHQRLTRPSKELALDWSKFPSVPFEEVRRQYINAHPRA